MPDRIRSEGIEPPDPPDANTIEELATAFARVPRIVEAWLGGERMTPEDGSPAWEATHITLVLDPPLPDEPSEIGEEIAAINESLASTNWVRGAGRERDWIYAPHDGRFVRSGVRIYSRDVQTP